MELAVDNIIVNYLYDQFGLTLATAGGLGSLFGFMNIFSRASGGMLSDLVAKKCGMRGRLWTLWTLQTLGGVFCLVMGYVDYTQTGTIIVMIIFSIFCQQVRGKQGKQALESTGDGAGRQAARQLRALGHWLTL